MRLLSYILSICFFVIILIVMGLGVYYNYIYKQNIMAIAFSSDEEFFRDFPEVWMSKIYHSQLSKSLVIFSMVYFAIMLFMHKINWKVVFLSISIFALLIAEYVAGVFFHSFDIFSGMSDEQLKSMPWSSFRGLPWFHLHVVVFPIMLVIILLLFFRKIKDMEIRMYH